MKSERSLLLSAVTGLLLAFTPGAVRAQETAPEPTSTSPSDSPQAAAPPAPVPPQPVETPTPVTATTNSGEGAAPVPVRQDPAAPVEVTVAPTKSNDEILREEIAKLTLEKDRILAESMLRKEKLALEFSDRREALDRAKLVMEERNQVLADANLDRQEKLENDLSALREETERLKIEKDAAAVRAEMRLNELKIEEAELKSKLGNLSLGIAAKEKEMEVHNYTDSEPVYLENPLEGRTLTLSDRRIELNGMISSSTADNVAARIDYFNNKDPKMPIFLVIDNSPGGSVMAGYRILKAMEGSQAPVFVVVKSFAASMAACITTLADRSFAYPNAVLLHHQIASIAMGNLTQQRESLITMEEWWKRLAEPIAAKMGITRDEFIKRMYAEVSSGDWEEFADDAQKLKWVDEIVDTIRETSITKNPDSRRVQIVIPQIEVGQAHASDQPVRLTPDGYVEQIDEAGLPYVRVPRPNPRDVFYLYNPDNYYRFR